jgi:acyl carrier protein
MDPGHHAVPASSTAPDTSVERILAIIRRDLMLGFDVPLAADTPLFGGEFELDSLDALLLMQSLEREFGFKMATSSFGPEAFRNATALKAFVDAHLR